MTARQIEETNWLGRLRPGQVGWQQQARFVLLLPALLLVLIVILVPAGIGIFHSFTDWDPGYESPWTGLANYRKLLASPVFHEILGNQAFLLLMVPLSVVSAVFLSLLLFEGTP